MAHAEVIYFRSTTQPNANSTCQSRLDFGGPSGLPSQRYLIRSLFRRGRDSSLFGFWKIVSLNELLRRHLVILQNWDTRDEHRQRRRGTRNLRPLEIRPRKGGHR